MSEDRRGFLLQPFIAAMREPYLRAIARLPERSREIRRLRLEEGLTWKAIASRVGISPGGANYIFRTAQRKIDWACCGDMEKLDQDYGWWQSADWGRRSRVVRTRAWEPQAAHALVRRAR
jgi:hypothetical protein